MKVTGSRRGLVLQGYFARSSHGVSTMLLPEGQLRLIGDGRPLAPVVQRAMEKIFQTDLAGVRVHQSPIVQALGAQACTVGDTICVAPGLCDRPAQQGVTLLAHELTHVVQQRSGRVVNPYGHGLAVVHDPRLEAEADSTGKRISAAIWARRAGSHGTAPANERHGQGSRQVAQPKLGAAVVQPYVFGWLGSYLGETGARIGSYIDQGVELAADYYATTYLGDRLGYPTRELSNLTFGLAYLATSLARTFLVSQGRRILNATLEYLGYKTKYEIGVVSWREGKFSDAVGHTSVAVLIDGKIIAMFGLSPNPLPNDLGLTTLTRLCLPGNGQVMDDRDMFNDHVSHIEIFGVNQSQWLQVQTRIQRDRTVAPRYSLIGIGGASCSTWALSVIRSAGISGGSFLDRYLVSLPRELAWRAHYRIGHQKLA